MKIKRVISSVTKQEKIIIMWRLNAAMSNNCLIHRTVLMLKLLEVPCSLKLCLRT